MKFYKFLELILLNNDTLHDTKSLRKIFLLKLKVKRRRSGFDGLEVPCCPLEPHVRAFQTRPKPSEYSGQKKKSSARLPLERK
jgi:hypothetical protein